MPSIFSTVSLWFCLFWQWAEGRASDTWTSCTKLVLAKFGNAYSAPSSSCINISARPGTHGRSNVTTTSTTIAFVGGGLRTSVVVSNSFFLLILYNIYIRGM